MTGILLELKRHPACLASAVVCLEAEAVRSSSRTLELLYRLSGAMGGLSLPPAAEPARADGLWQHTCFEAFVRASRDGPYHEFNLAPSAQWAGYGFSGYRNGMISPAMDPPHIRTRSSGDTYELRATLKLDLLPHLPGDAPWQLNLSAVIEDASGRKSYWALSHPPGKADFHHPDCFTLELPAPA
jgi:hypothetical protein